MKPSVVDAGYMHRNGHCRCGCCGALEDRTPGGRRERKREGWTYDATHGLGWICPPCVAHFRAELRSQEQPTERLEPGTADARPVRGFGLRRPRLTLPRRRRKDRKRRRLAAWRAHYEARGEELPADLEANLPGFMPHELASTHS